MFFFSSAAPDTSFCARLQGYAFGPPVRSLRASAYPSSPPAFAFRNLIEIAWSHVVMVICGIILTAKPAAFTALVATLFPSLSPTAVVAFLSTASMGIGSYSGMNLGYSSFTLSIQLLSLLPLPGVQPFDPREYHRLFNRAWRVQNVTKFWSKQWHNL